MTDSFSFITSSLFPTNSAIEDKSTYELKCSYWTELDLRVNCLYCVVFSRCGDLLIWNSPVFLVEGVKSFWKFTPYLHIFIFLHSNIWMKMMFVFRFFFVGQGLVCRLTQRFLSAALVSSNLFYLRNYIKKHPTINSILLSKNTNQS